MPKSSDKGTLDEDSMATSSFLPLSLWLPPQVEQVAKSYIQITQIEPTYNFGQSHAHAFGRGKPPV